MKKDLDLDWSERTILALYLEETVDHIVALLVDHSDGCPLRSAARRLMAIAGWTDEDLARAYFERVSL